MALSRFLTLLLLPLLLGTLLLQAVAADQAIPYTNGEGETVVLHDDRQPSLYTGSFGDCLGKSKSLITVTRFDASLYKDNMTVAFHIAGHTNLTRESVMVFIGVYAYGESRFELAWNPCGTNIISLCPAKSTVAIEASGYIPLGQQDIENIPNIALSIPDFEGQAILRIFANSTQSEIACYAASVSNGASFNQQASVGTVLALFTIVAIIASLAPATYGTNIPDIRRHYAHSLSILVVFAVFHHIYYTGALSMNWPSNLVAFWANYAWATGMINVPSMQDSISNFMGRYRGNTLAVGAASAGSDSSSVGGGYDVHQIYKRTYETARFLKRSLAPALYDNTITKRDLANSTTGFKYYGTEVRAGLPLPGNYSGFAGTLSEDGIPAANAFLTGFIFFLIALLIIAGSITIFRFVLEGLYRANKVKSTRLIYFRNHWKRFIVFSVLRACYVAFFMLMFLTIFQFTYDGSPGAIAIAAIVFTVFLFGSFGMATFACYQRLQFGTWISEPDKLFIEKTKTLRFIPWYHFHRGSTVQGTDKVFVGSLPFWRVCRVPEGHEISVHEDENYIMHFGWLSSRFRESRWWFFAGWLFYEFVRAVFYAGASGHPLIQVFCLLVVEIVAFSIIVKLKPFEGQRLNIIMVYLLGFSKVITVALSSAFDVTFNIQRIPATVIGVLIIVIQGLLTFALIVCIIMSAMSSYFSVTRHKDVIHPTRWMPYRTKYLAHLEKLANSTESNSEEPQPAVIEEVKPTHPYFSVNSVRRIAKIEDEDGELQRDIASDPRYPYGGSLSRLSQANLTSSVGSKPSLLLNGGPQLSRRASVSQSIHSNMSHSSLPAAAILHRGSWSTRDVSEMQAERAALDPDQRIRSSTVFVPSLDKEGWLKTPKTPVVTATLNGISRQGSRESFRASGGVASAPSSSLRSSVAQAYSTPPQVVVDTAFASSSPPAGGASPVAISPVSATARPTTPPPNAGLKRSESSPSSSSKRSSGVRASPPSRRAKNRESIEEEQVWSGDGSE